MRGKKVIHDDEVNLFSIWHLDSVEAVELRQERMGIVCDMFKVIFQDLPQKLMLCVVDSLDDILIVSGKIKKATTLAWRAQLRQNILARERHEIIGRVQPKKCTKMPEDPGRIILELEVIFCRGD